MPFGALVQAVIQFQILGESRAVNLRELYAETMEKSIALLQRLAFVSMSFGDKQISQRLIKQKGIFQLRKKPVEGMNKPPAVVVLFHHFFYGFQSQRVRIRKIRAEEENEAKHHENQRFFKESLEKALIEINKEKEKCLREYLEELKDIAVAVAEKVIHISLRSSGSVISRMIEAETEKLQKMDWVKIYMEKEDYETMVQADGHLAEKLSRLSDNVKFIVMEDGKCGSCIIEMPDGIIDMSVDTQLENIHRLVDNANT